MCIGALTKYRKILLNDLSLDSKEYFVLQIYVSTNFVVTINYSIMAHFLISKFYVVPKSS